MTRYHSLDALRAFAMLLGIVLHGGISYVAAYNPDMAGWPTDPSSSPVILLMIVHIHTWRMQAFFLMAGFFANLVIARRGTRAFIKNRIQRILVPLVVGLIILVPALFGVVIYGAWQMGTLDQWEPAPVESTQTYRVPYDDDVVPASDDGEGIPLMHLWFLYALLWLYAITLVMRAILPARQRIMAWLDRRITWVMRSRWRVVWLAIPTTILRAPVVTEDVTIAAPNFPLLFYYLFFFWIGWMLYRQPDLLTTVHRRRVWVPYLVLGTVVFLPLSFLGGVFLSLQTWLVIFGLIGLFETVNQKSRTWVRWLSDASYWVYLGHMPLVGLVAAFLIDYQLPVLVKFSLVCGVTAGVLLVTYQWFVRYSVIGRTLNGPRPRLQPV